jgi:hypothetical protein
MDMYLSLSDREGEAAPEEMCCMDCGAGAWEVCEESCRSNRAVVMVEFVNPPIPVRDCDYAAFFEGREEGIVGRGPSRETAIAALLAEVA